MRVDFEGVFVGGALLGGGVAIGFRGAVQSGTEHHGDIEIAGIQLRGASEVSGGLHPVPFLSRRLAGIDIRAGMVLNQEFLGGVNGDPDPHEDAEKYGEKPGIDSTTRHE